MSPAPAAQQLALRIDTALTHIGSTRVTMPQVRALIALGDAGTYSAAATSISLSPPTLHRAIGDLAVIFRRPLVERRGRGLALTDSGRRILRAFRLARAELEAGLDEVATIRGRETGRIAVGAMPLSRARILPAAIVAFCREFPEAHVSVMEGAWHELIEPLRDGSIDLMVGALRNPPPGEDLIQQSLFNDHPVVLGRRGHPARESAAAGRWPEILRHLATFPWVVPEPGTPLRTQWARLFEAADLPQPTVPITCGSVLMNRQILIASDCLTLLSPDQVAVELEAGWLEIVAELPASCMRDIGLTVRTSWRPTAIQAAFLRYLRGAVEETDRLTSLN